MLKGNRFFFSKATAYQWAANEAIEEGYIDEKTTDKKVSRVFPLRDFPAEKYTSVKSSAPLTDLFRQRENWFKNKCESKGRSTVFLFSKRKVLDTSDHTVALNNGQLLRKLDLIFCIRVLQAPGQSRSIGEFILKLSRKKESNSSGVRIDSGITGRSSDRTYTEQTT